MSQYLLPAHSITTRDTIHHGDARVVAAGLPAASIDLIYTDPQYHKAMLWSYGWLAELGARVLKPDGWLLAMGGGLYADRILAAMSAHLDYHYTLQVQLTGSAAAVWRPHGQQTPVIARFKPIYAFARGRSAPRTVVQTPFAGDGNDKRWHHWGQEEKSTRYVIDCFSHPGDVVLDPFVGGGTTAVVCQQIGRHFIGIDCDPEAVATARGRLADPFYRPRVEADGNVSDLPLFARGTL